LVPDDDKSPAAHATPFLIGRGFSKTFGGVKALRDVDIDIRRGEIHGLVGANGAGKSTLIKILAGLEQPDAGSLSLDGRPTVIEGPDRATALGLSFIHQELHLVEQMDVLENITLGSSKPTRFGMVNWRRVAELVSPVAQRIGIDFSLTSTVSTLSTAQKWLVSICRALVRQSRLIVMDEPTASLSAAETESLFRIVRDLAREGVAVLYVSHRLDEILALCDRVTTLRDGRRVDEIDRTVLTRRRLVEAIVGADVAEVSGRARIRSGEPIVLRVERLRRRPAVRNVSFALHRGEVLGLGGLVGAGRSETARIIFGADSPEGGKMILDGVEFRPRSPYDAMRAGIGFIPEERRSEGLVIDKSIAFNIGLTQLRSLWAAPGIPLIDMSRRASRADEVVRRLAMKTPSVAEPVGRLSGGNQQKVVIGKWLDRGVKLLILDEPSRGVDIAARSEIHRIIRELAAGGQSIIVISADPEELPELCDRVLVMSEGELVDELVGPAITREAILHASYMRPDPRAIEAEA
jgi:ABC-type sugar transport system ATPase subunit